MTLRDFVTESVRRAYWDENLICIPTVLGILGELYDYDINEQVYDSCWGLNGAGKYGAQCGLVEGALMFVGLLAHRYDVGRTELSRACNEFASNFEKRFGSLQCRDLRPGGFNDDDPPHLCEGLTVESLEFAAAFIADWFEIELKVPEPKSKP